jgi:hypothetical protein
MKSALLIGCNYPNSPLSLQGCINDVLKVKAMLIANYGFSENEIVVMRDDYPLSNPLYPSAINMDLQITKWVDTSNSTELLYFHYSGHGSNVKDVNKDELDGYDEFIVPSDFLKSKKVITDDNIYNYLKKLNDKCPTFLSFDCCMSGTVCDLGYSYYYNSSTKKFSNRNENKDTSLVNKNITAISAVKDNQYALDVQTEVTPMGAFTMSLITSLSTLGYDVPLNTLISSIYVYLISRKYANMSPIISCCRETDLDTLYFMSSGLKKPITNDSTNPNVATITEYLKNQLANKSITKQELLDIVSKL